MSKLLNSVVAGTFVLLAAATANAAPVTVYVTDHTSSGLVDAGCQNNNCNPATWYNPSQGYLQTITNGPSWALGKQANFGDVIGDHNFDINKLAITRDGSNITFAVTTAFPGNYDGAMSADIFLDTNASGTLNNWNYVVSFGSSYTRDGATAGLYSISSANDYRTSDQVWSQQGGGIGGLIQLCSPGNNSCTGPAPGWNGRAVAPAVLFNPTGGGSSLVGTSTGVSRTYDPLSGYYTLSQTISGIGNMALFNYFDVLAASADCSNDALASLGVSTVPAPGALALLGLGLIGIGALRRKVTAA